MRCRPCCETSELPVKLKKYGNFFCDHASVCKLCNIRVTGNLYPTHYMAAHHTQTYEAGWIFRISASDIWKWCIIDADFGGALCKYKLDENGFTFLVYTPMLTNTLSMYNCEIAIIHAANAATLHYLAECNYQGTADWYLHVPIEEMCSFIIHNKVDIQISFVEN